MRATRPPPHLSAFQKNYSEHLRSPETVPCPEGIPKARSLIYQELLFNNTYGFIEKCFPVAQTLFTSDQWIHLNKMFFKNWSCHTPLFSEIPKEFVQFITQKPELDEGVFPEGLPPWLSALLDYEYLELVVDLSPETFAVEEHETHTLSNLIRNPTLKVAQYEWPVHQIHAGSIPVEPELTILLVYRNHSDYTQFMEINPMTAALVQLFDELPITKEAALEELCNSIEGIRLEQAMQFGLPLIEEMVAKQVLIAQTPD